MGRHFSNILAVLCLWIICDMPAQADPVTIYRNLRGKTWIEANSTSDIGYRIQASADYAAWTDISDAASGPFSYIVDTQLAAFRVFRLRTWSTQDTPITLVLLGDSTVAELVANDNLFYGWGAGIYGYLKPNVRAVNLAVPLQSTKSFLVSMQKDSLVAIQPDFVLIDFGLVDTSELEGWHTTLAEYEANLKQIVQIVRDFKGTPILVTPTGGRFFDAAGKFMLSLPARCEVVRSVAAQTQTYLIDLNQLTATLFDELGPAVTRSDYITLSADDPAHFSLSGAKVVAGLTVNAFPNILASQVIKP